MSVFLRIDINLAAIALLGVVHLIAFAGLDRRDGLNRKFLNTSGFVLLELFFETLTCVINKRPEPWLIPASVVVHLCLFLTAPVLTYLYFSFVRSWVLPDGRQSRGIRLALLAPIVASGVLSVLSPVYGLVFSVSGQNEYQRGPLFMLSAAIVYFYLLCSFILVIRQRKRIIRSEFIPLMAVSLFAILGGLAQSVFYGVLLMWSSAAFTLVIVYVFLQKRMIHLDSLTGAWTRESFDFFISQKKADGRSEAIGMIFLDIDGLKQINDRFGHAEGDFAIRTAAQILRGSLRKTDVVARVGGDEFIVILECASQDILDGTVGRIREALQKHNRESGKKYSLECSFGADLYGSGHHSIEQFLHHVDSLMYGDKKRKEKAVPSVKNEEGEPDESYSALA